MKDIIYSDKKAMASLGVLNVVYQLMELINKDKPDYTTIKLVLDSNKHKFYGE